MTHASVEPTLRDLRRPRALLAFLSIWALLQLPRLIAIPLISDVVAGRDDAAWMYPAILDVVVAVAAIPVAWLIWRRRGLLPFVAGIVFLVVSIVDHGGPLHTVTHRTKENTMINEVRLGIDVACTAAHQASLADERGEFLWQGWKFRTTT